MDLLVPREIHTQQLNNTKKQNILVSQSCFFVKLAYGAE